MLVFYGWVCLKILFFKFDCFARKKNFYILIHIYIFSCMHIYIFVYKYINIFRTYMYIFLHIYKYLFYIYRYIFLIHTYVGKNGKYLHWTVCRSIICYWMRYVENTNILFSQILDTIFMAWKKLFSLSL